MCFLKGFYWFHGFKWKRIEFWKEKTKEAFARFGRRKWSSAAEHGKASGAPLASESLVWTSQGSAAESQVRPPNMHEFRGHVRLPKVFDQATYKRPSDRKWVSFLPILELRWVYAFLWSFSCFLYPSLKFFMISTLVFEDLKLKRSFGSLELLELGFSIPPS